MFNRTPVHEIPDSPAVKVLSNGKRRFDPVEKDRLIDASTPGNGRVGSREGTACLKSAGSASRGHIRTT
ncbi:MULTISPECIES: hypothetical protein [Rhizobium]|uniref:hypothetical protein n=1 Tax=Rhizobium TaxID=379 RepID=UPI000321D575|nr:MULTISPECIES: hypothetical protein [Rhizobium]